GAIDAIAGWPSAAVLTIQNGIGAEDAVVARRPGGPLIAGSLTAALERDGGTTVRMTNRGALGLAPVSAGTADLLPALAAAFSVGGLPARTMTDAASMKWSKLLTNLVGNATSAILDLEPHAIYADARLFEVEQGQMLEALAVMAARRLRPIALPAADARLLAVAFRLPPAVARRVLARAVGGARGGKWPSLAAHLRSGTGGPTEARWLNGAVALAGEAAGVATPINRVLAGLVDEAAADPARRDWYRGRPDRLLDVLASSA
ncbi:MAG TPA: ketopantoate reductase C-terminal domain-containing protein, partial [Candidatus Limnocylindrales bacterium]